MVSVPLKSLLKNSIYIMRNSGERKLPGRQLVTDKIKVTIETLFFPD